MDKLAQDLIDGKVAHKHPFRINYSTLRDARERPSKNAMEQMRHKPYQTKNRSGIIENKEDILS